MKPAPCVDCLIIPICRRRYFIDMKNKCKLVEKYLFKAPSFAGGRNDFDTRVNRVHDAINPVHWKKRHQLVAIPVSCKTQEFRTGPSDRTTVRFWKEMI